MGPRLAAYGVLLAVLAALVAGAWVTVAGWRSDSLALPGVQMRLAAEIAASRTARAYQRDRSKEIAADEKRLADAAAAVPARPVRLCVNPPVPATTAGAGPQGAGTAAGAGALPAGVGANPVQGPDIGPDVRALMLEAERVLGVARAGQRHAVEVEKLASHETENR